VRRFGATNVARGARRRAWTRLKKLRNLESNSMRHSDPDIYLQKWRFMLTHAEVDGYDDPSSIDSHFQ
jgi:hypothetical protein